MATEMGEKQLFGITIAVVAAALLLVGVFTFLSYRKYSALKVQTRRLESEIKGHERIIATRKGLERDKQESEARFNAVKQYLPSQKEVEKLILDFSNKCIESGLDNRKLDTVTAVVAGRRPQGGAKQQYETIRYKCEFRGTFHALAKFVSMVENWKHFKRFVNITEFRMKAAREGLAFDTGGQRHKIEMTLDLYKYQPPKPPPVLPAAGTSVAKSR